MTQLTTISYENIFTDDPKPVEEYLKGLNKSDLIEAICFLIAKQKEGLHISKIIDLFFSAGNRKFRIHVSEKCRSFEMKAGPIGLLQPLSIYRLCEMALENNEPHNPNLSKEEFERNIFLAIIAQNQHISLSESKVGVSCAGLGKMEAPAILFSLQFPSYELVNYSINELIISQLVRAVYLFEFLSYGDPVIQDLLKDFCEYYGYGSWTEYLKAHLSLILPIIKKQRQAQTELFVDEGEDFESSCSFLDKLNISNQEIFSDDDYIRLRSMPLYNFKKGHYLIISDLFLIETLFKGVFFKLSQLNSINGELGKPFLKNFRSYYCDNFSERHILYAILEDIYSNYINYSGSAIKEITKLDAEPDYYVRNGKYLYLFESKDILIKKEIKGSFDFSLYEPEIKKRLYKAVCQLTNNIQRSFDRAFKFDTNYKPKNLIVIPIILLHDRCYSTPGLNKIVIEWFNDELEKLKEAGYPIKNIRPVTLVNIDTIILLHNRIKNRSLSLDSMIRDYHSNMTLKQKKYKDKEHLHQSALDTYMSFDDFAKKFITRTQIHPKLKNLAEALFST